MLKVNEYGGRQTKVNEKRQCFKGWETLVSKLNNYKYIKAEQRDVSFEAINLIKGLIEARVYRKDDTIIYIGDSLTENGYEFYLNDLLKIIPLLIENIPQHHYFLSQDYTKIIYISFENEIEFGEISSNIHD